MILESILKVATAIVFIGVGGSIQTMIDGGYSHSEMAFVILMVIIGFIGMLDSNRRKL